jgi:hypothetical protein
MYSSPSSFVDSSIGGARFVNVKLAVWKDSRWNIETVLESSNLGEFGNMVLDSNGHPHFLATQRRYLSAETPTLLSAILYVRWDGSAWKTQTVASDVPSRNFNIGFLALGPDGSPRIVYKAGGVIYTRWTGTAWESETVGDATDKTCYLAVDSNGNPHITYLKVSPDPLYNPDILNLMYATANVTEPEVSPAFPDFPLVIVSAAIVIGTVIAVIAYVWKKKTKH